MIAHVVKTWYDPDTTDTLFLVAKDYGLTVVLTKNIGPNEIEFEISGAEDTIRQFVDDLEDYSFDCLEKYRDLSDHDYLSEISKELGKIGILFVPDFSKYEDDEDEEEVA